MDNRNIILLIIATALIGALYITGQKNANWNSWYSFDGKHPNDLGLFTSLLEDQDSNNDITILNQPIYTYDTSVTDQLVIRIHNNILLDSQEVISFLDHAKRGNEVFFSSKYSTDVIAEKVFDLEKMYPDIYEVNNDEDGNIENLKYYEEEIWDSCATFTLHAVDRNFEYCHFNNYKKTEIGLNFYDSTITNYTNDGFYVEGLGKLQPEDQYNFLKINHGKGAIYLHLQPNLFCNWYVKEKQGFTYVKEVFKHTNHSNIAWYSNNYHRNEIISRSPLKYIFSKESLKWAWYLLLAGTTLFVIFYAKRRQRIVPPTSAFNNSSIAFANSIGLLYYNENRRIQTAKIMGKNLYHYIAEKHGLRYRPDAEIYFDQLAAISTMSADEIRKIYLEIENTRNPEYWTKDRFHRLQLKIEQLKNSLNNDRRKSLPRYQP